MERAYNKLIKFLGSREFFYVVVGLFVIQALWMAISFRYPSPYDEWFHFDIIKIYSHQLSPIIVNQDPSYDYLRDLTHESSHFYHYLMSFPYRLISWVTSNTTAQIIALRIINVGLATWGLVMFGRLFREMKIRQVYINIGLLFFTLLPVVSQISSIINYDNLLFLLTAWYLLFCTRILLIPNARWQEYAGVVIVGTVASLVKYTFLPVFAVSMLYLVVVLYRRGLSRQWHDFVKSLRESRRSVVGLIGVFAIVLVGLFVQLYVQNMIRYGTPQPSCLQTMPEERCLKSWIVGRNITAEQTKNQRPLQSPEQYAFLWFLSMQGMTDLTFSNTISGTREEAPPLPLFYAVTFLGTIIGIGVLLYSWRTLPKNNSWYFMATISVALLFAVFLENYSVYRQIHWALTIQSRYFLSIIPIALVMMAAATGHALRQHKSVKLISLLVALLLTTQGAGLVTHILRSNDGWYWQNPMIIKTNHAAKKVLHPLVME